MTMISEIASLCQLALLSYFIALFLTLLVLAIIAPSVEITPPEPRVEPAQPEPIRQRRGARRQLYY